MFDIDTSNAAFQDQDGDFDGREVTRNLRDIADRPDCATGAGIRGVNENTAVRWSPSFYSLRSPEHTDPYSRLHGAVEFTVQAARGYVRV